MGLAAGTRLGPYQIVGALGAGGMGEVYRARDPRLDRDVAVKVLPTAFANDPTALARFERESKAVASLSHPNIVAIHDVGRHDGLSYAVMELLEGETLRQRLTHGALPLHKAVEYGARVAHALGAAHERGVLHRDVKPDNIFITTNGHVKVLDFGLAVLGKSESADAATLNSPTIAPETSPGMVLGTVGYMSPEQVRGAAVDHRSDIFSLGAVLYEMLSGRRAFAHDTAPETMTAILKEDPPDLVTSGVQAPPAIARIVKRCLEKSPGERFHSAHDLGVALETLSTDSGPSASVVSIAPVTRQRGRERLAWITATTLLLVSLVATTLLWRANTRTTGVAATPMRVTLRFPAGSPMHLGVPHPSLAISPQGDKIVYTANGPEGAQLWLHSLDQFDPTPIPGTGEGPRNAFFSPDGRFIAFFADNKLKRIAVAGGVSTVICDAPQAYGGTWTTKDEIVFTAWAPDMSLWRVAASGGKPQMIVKGIYTYPDALPGGDSVLASSENPRATTSSELRIVVVDVTTGAVQQLLDGGAYPRYAATGHLLFLRNGSVTAMAFDPVSGRLGDQAVAVVSGLFMNQANAGANYAVSPAGALAYAPSNGTEFQRSLIAIDMKGSSEPLTNERRYFQWPRISPDGQRIAVTIPAWRDGVWIFDRTRALLTELTSGDLNGVAPVWTPDGTRVVFATYGVNTPRNLYWMAADGSGTSERLTTAPDEQRPNSFTPDGKTLVYELRAATNTDLWTLTFDDKRTTRPLLATRFRESQAAVSPDGKWMAYTSDQSGSAEVYLSSFPSLERRIQVSVGGGGNPAWSRDGKRLFYRKRFADEIMAVDVALGSPVSLSKPVTIARVRPAPPLAGSFDVMHDGRLLLVDNEQEEAGTQELRIVLNWFEELKQKGPK